MINTKYRKIRTEIPHLEDLKFIKELDKVESISSHKNLPIVWDYAKNSSVWDRHGNKFIDFSSGIFVTNTGHNSIVKALRIQTIKHLIYSYTFPTEIRLKLLQKLTKFTKFDKAFLLSTGAEAIECACKIMRLFSKKQEIISFKDSMHGKTSLAENLKKNYEWATNDIHIHHLNFPDNSTDFNKDFELSYFDSIKNIAGFIIESYRGWDAQFYPKKYIQDLIKFAKKHNILVCFDEIQGGFGRTGKLFAYEHYNIEQPDLVCIGKGFGGGIPISAVLGKKELLDVPTDLSSTYSSNPLSCAGALANIELIEQNDLIKKAKRKEKIIIHELSNYIFNNPDSLTNIVKKINCKGLLVAIVFNNKEFADKVCLEALKRGVIVVKTDKESIKIGPPLTINNEALIEGLKVVEEVILELSKLII